MNFTKYIHLFTKAFVDCNSYQSPEEKKELKKTAYELANQILLLNKVSYSNRRKEKIADHLEFLLPADINTKGVNYDIKKNQRTQKYFKCMIYISRYVENINKNRPKKIHTKTNKEISDEYRLFNTFPLKTGEAPGYITLDSANVVDLLWNDDVLGKCERNSINEMKSKERHFELWNIFFNINKDKERIRKVAKRENKVKSLKRKLNSVEKQKKRENAIIVQNNEKEIYTLEEKKRKHIFKMSGLHFNKMICTDGIGCSIIFSSIKEVMAERNMTERYITELDDVEKVEFRHRQVVGIDPNKNDIISAGMRGVRLKYSDTFRYTHHQIQDERRVEKYNKIRLKESAYPDEETRLKFETLSTHNHKTVFLDDFKEYCRVKNAYSISMAKIYDKQILRKLKFNTYINTKRSEDIMVNKFKRKFGNPSDVVIGFGDYSNSHMKGCPPVKGKGMRNQFRRHGFPVFLVNEFRTSCMCSNGCGGGSVKMSQYSETKMNEASKFLKGEFTSKAFYGLFKCKICNNLWNRNVNSSLNIYDCAYNAIREYDRPEHLRRIKKDEVEIISNNRAGRGHENNDYSD